MTAMNPSLESAILASLQNPAHAWSVLSTVTHFTPATAGLTLNTGGLDPLTVTGPSSPSHTTITYQLQSEVLQLVLVVMARLTSNVFEDMDVYYRGSAFTTTDSDIYDEIASMALPELETQQSEFEALLKQLFAPSVSMQASATLIAQAQATVI